ncbi:MAG: hypothetical protein CML66_24080 [Rhodobacteraceae bacterium]|nr:hypothetical protein [Paracoccaceae bacterium]
MTKKKTGAAAPPSGRSAVTDWLHAMACDGDRISHLTGVRNDTRCAGSDGSGRYLSRVSRCIDG